MEGVRDFMEGLRRRQFDGRVRQEGRHLFLLGRQRFGHGVAVDVTEIDRLGLAFHLGKDPPFGLEDRGIQAPVGKVRGAQAVLRDGQLLQRPFGEGIGLARARPVADQQDRVPVHGRDILDGHRLRGEQGFGGAVARGHAVKAGPLVRDGRENEPGVLEGHFRRLEAVGRLPATEDVPAAGVQDDHGGRTVRRIFHGRNGKPVGRDRGAEVAPVAHQGALAACLHVIIADPGVLLQCPADIRDRLGPIDAQQGCRPGEFSFTSFPSPPKAARVFSCPSGLTRTRTAGRSMPAFSAYTAPFPGTEPA